MDLVPNHVYMIHPYFKKKKFIKKREVVRHLAFLSFYDLPKLNQTNKDVQTHLINSTEKFLKYGIDVVHIDHCIGSEFQSLKNIINKINESFPNAPFIGEEKFYLLEYQIIQKLFQV